MLLGRPYRHEGMPFYSIKSVISVSLMKLVNDFFFKTVKLSKKKENRMKHVSTELSKLKKKRNTELKISL